MRCAGVLVVALVILALPVLGQGQALYKLDQQPTTYTNRSEEGREVKYVTVKFTVTPLSEQAADVDGTYKVHIYENREPVKTVDLPRPEVSGDLSVILALDCSGGMQKLGKMVQARKAAGVFFDQLPASAEAGAILFDHQVIDTAQLTRERGQLRSLIDNAKPRGGTAYYDATLKAIEMLAGVRHRDRYVVLMTDGVDINSDKSLEDVVRQAKQKGVKIHTVGIGEPGKQSQLTTVLALDRSGSMLAPAEANDKVLKIGALQDAALRFVRTIREDGLARSAILEFSTDLKAPTGFSNDRFFLQRQIKELYARGETALFDATYAAVGMLAAERASGKKAVIALTDGIDNTSRRRPEEVIERAKEAGIPLFLLGFGRKGELDEKTMDRMARATGGKYYSARNQQELINVFEDLSVELNDDGIDEKALKKLSSETGGVYYSARDVNQLEMILKRVTKALERKEYTITFRSMFQKDTGLQIPVELKLVRSSGELVGVGSEGRKEEVIGATSSGYQTRGVVIAEMDHLVYVGLLMALGVLLIVPAGLKRLTAKKG